MGILRQRRYLWCSKEAGAAKAKLIIAATGSDEARHPLLFLLPYGHREHHCQSPQPELRRSITVPGDLGISMTVQPGHEDRQQKYQNNPFHARTSIRSRRQSEEVAGGQNPTLGQPLHLSIHEMWARSKVIICADCREAQQRIRPSGDFVLHCDDVISITGTRPGVLFIADWRL